MEKPKEEKDIDYLQDNCHFNALANFPNMILLILIKAAEKLLLSPCGPWGWTCQDAAQKSKRKCLPYGFSFHSFRMVTLLCDFGIDCTSFVHFAIFNSLDIYHLFFIKLMGIWHCLIFIKLMVFRSNPF